MTIPRYANNWEDCGSATHGTIRRHHSWGFCPQHHNISDYIRCEIAATSDIVLFFPSMWRLYQKYFYFSIAFYYSTMLHYVFIKFRARYFHYVSMPTEILSQDFISEFHLLFQQRFTQIFDEVTHSPQLSVIPGTAIATVSLDN